MIRLKLANRAEALALHQAVGSSPGVIAHCKAVARLAKEMADWIDGNGTLVDIDAVEAGALLHDIGRSRTQGIDHAVVGANLVLEAGYPEGLAAIVRHHIGVGLDRHEAEALGLPVADYTPQNLEELIVSHADNLTRHVAYRSLEDTLAHFQLKGLDRVADQVAENHQDLERLVGVPIESLY